MVIFEFDTRGLDVLAMDCLSPESLEAIRLDVARETAATESFDRRGFRLLQWPSAHTDRKPVELSLEHEARLKPASTNAVHGLLAALMASRGQRLDRVLLGKSKALGGLTLHQVPRRPGPQSVDLYFDLPDGFPLISKGFTFRQRTQGSNFMSWAGGEDGLAALNLELPAVDLERDGLTARLEFNWLDEVARTLASLGEQSNPAYWGAKLAVLDLADLIPVLENGTVRQKFMARNAAGEDEFAVNVDFVEARSLRDGRTARFTDVDLSSMRPVSQRVFDGLAELSGELMTRFDLAFNFATKASRAMQLLG